MARHCGGLYTISATRMNRIQVMSRISKRRFVYAAYLCGTSTTTTVSHGKETNPISGVTKSTSMLLLNYYCVLTSASIYPTYAV